VTNIFNIKTEVLSAEIMDMNPKQGIVTGYFSKFNNVDGDGDIIRPLIERTDIRMNNQIYRLSTDNTGIITNIGFQINDGTTARNGFFGSSSGGIVDTANLPEVAYIFSGAGGTALTSYNGFYIDRTVLAETKVYSGFSGSVRQVIGRSATTTNNKLTQVGTWGSTIDSTFYEAIPSARTIQIGSTAGNNNWVKLDGVRPVAPI